MNTRELILASSVLFGSTTAAPVPALAARCLPDTFLTVQGESSAVGTEVPAVVVSEGQLMALPMASISTATDWTAASRFDGPLLSDVLALAKVSGKSIRLFALNDYSITIPWSDMDRYGIILAHSQNGERLSKRKFGPLFLMYPRDQFAAALDTPTGAEKFIWQVCGIHVR